MKLSRRKQRYLIESQDLLRATSSELEPNYSPEMKDLYGAPFLDWGRRNSICYGLEVAKLLWDISQASPAPLGHERVITNSRYCQAENKHDEAHFKTCIPAQPAPGFTRVIRTVSLGEYGIFRYGYDVKWVQEKPWVKPTWPKKRKGCRDYFCGCDKCKLWRKEYTLRNLPPLKQRKRKYFKHK